MSESTPKPLTYDQLARAVAGNAAAIRCRTRLQPAAGPGTKVFPPTHAGGVYATEQRRLPDREQPVECVLLDSVQSQANRIEDALQDAVDRGILTMPIITVDFGDQIGGLQRVTSLQAPHRAADAILRDSTLEGQPFRTSDIGRAITDSGLTNATALFQYCPHALILGMWDSTGPRGGSGSKFARALVSEIVGVDVSYGVRTGSRLDPLQTAKQAGPLFRRANGSWTLNPAEAVQELDKKGQPTGRVLLYKKVKKKDNYFDPVRQAGEVPDAGKPSSANHGNVTPDLVRYKDSIESLGIKKNDIAVGGVTVAYAEHSAVLSLPQLRRLRFPLDGTVHTDIDDSARTVLAALALVGLTLSIERGTDLRSRCLLFPESPVLFELLVTPGAPEAFSLNSEQAVEILHSALAAARGLNITWRTDPLVLEPSPDLVALVQRSQELAGIDDEED